MPQSDPVATAQSLEVTTFSFAGGAVSGGRHVPVEMPVNIVFSPMPYAVMMATPQDLEDFAIGFSRTEGIIDTIEDVRDIRVEPVDGGMQVEMTLAGSKMQRHLARKRSMSGRTGCGVCGIEDMASLPLSQVMLTPRVLVAVTSVRRAMQELVLRQDLNRVTRAVHAAAWCNLSGELQIIREDVGRHNALDKLIGALMRAGANPAEGFVVVTSRCSFEMVEKAAAFGVSAIVAISAPTSLAIQRARQHDMTMLASTRDDGTVCFTHPERVVAERGLADQGLVP